MAYLNFLASVGEARVAAFQRDPSRALGASLVRGCSHLVAYSLAVEPLGTLLGDLIDRGETLHGSLWHPLRPPVWHGVGRVAELAEALSREWLKLGDVEGDAGGWYRGEVASVVELATHAARHGECVVSALEPPLDPERAARVILPRLE